MTKITNVDASRLKKRPAWKYVFMEYVFWEELGSGAGGRISTDRSENLEGDSIS